MATIAVVGTIVDDVIHHRDGRVVRSLGGLTYAVGALAALADDRVRILPICRVNRALRDRLTRHWRGHPSISLEGLVMGDHPATGVRLDYRRPRGRLDREERLTNPLPPLEAAELARAAGSDLILVNCISGFDVELTSLEEVAGRRVPVHLDIHSLALERLADGTRRPRPVPDAARWLALPRVVQCNRSELAMLTPSGSASEVVTMLSAGAEGVVVTGGADGATVLTRQGKRHEVAAPAIDLVDPTGAGDTFGAALALGRLRGDTLIDACRFATRAASAACCLEGTDALFRLPATIASLDGRTAPEAASGETRR